MKTALALLTLTMTLNAYAGGIRRYTSGEQGFAVNSWLVPTQAGLIVVDAQFTVSEAERLVAAIKQVGRPLRGIIITHPHPDHYNGTCRLLALESVPVYALPATLQAIEATAQAKRAEWKPTYGKDYPDKTCPPDHIVKPGDKVRIDGIDFAFHDFGAGEALDESLITSPTLRAAFVGDLIYNKVHPWLAEGRSAEWLAQLARLQIEVPKGWRIYPGHGAEAHDTVIDAQRKYITDFRAAIKAKLGPAGLSAADSQSVVERFRTSYPRWDLEGLVPINVDATAKELRHGGEP